MGGFARLGRHECLRHAARRAGAAGVPAGGFSWEPPKRAKKVRSRCCLTSFILMLKNRSMSSPRWRCCGLASSGARNPAIPGPPSLDLDAPPQEWICALVPRNRPFPTIDVGFPESPNNYADNQALTSPTELRRISRQGLRKAVIDL